MKTSKKQKPRYTLIQKTIIGIIVIASIITTAALIILFLFNPEHKVKNHISSFASDYYENHLYKNAISSNTTRDPEQIFKDYRESGLSTVYLRQLLYYRNHDKETTDYIKNYCDENRTWVKFYPEPPYSKSSYRIEYNYSCEFK